MRGSGKPPADDVEAAPVMIVRHAQSASNAGARTTDPISIPITPIGARQARCVATLLSKPPLLVVVSQFVRTLQTAKRILRDHPRVTTEQWHVHEFTYLNTDVCRGTTYAERKQHRDAYWRRCDPCWIDGPGCESFIDFISRVKQFRNILAKRCVRGETLVVTHGLLIRALLWLDREGLPEVDHQAMRKFHEFRRGVSVPNCAVLRGKVYQNKLQLCDDVSIAHLPTILQTE